jgi:hypothetical protein
MKKTRLIVWTLAGVLAGWGVYFSAQPVFQAQTRIGVVGDDAWLPAQVTQLLQRAFDRAGLEDIIQKEHLYDEERRTTTIADVVERMRRDIEIRPRMVNLATVTFFTVGFRHTRPRTAMIVTERLASRVILASLDRDDLRPTEWLDPSPAPIKIRGLKVRDGARLPVEPVAPRLLPHLTIGALAGLGMGIIFLIASRVWRNRRPVAH